MNIILLRVNVCVVYNIILIRVCRRKENAPHVRFREEHCYDTCAGLCLVKDYSRSYWQNIAVYLIEIIFSSLAGRAVGELVALAYHVLYVACYFLRSEFAASSYYNIIIKTLVGFFVQLCHTYDLVAVFHNNCVTEKHTLAVFPLALVVKLAF